MLSRRAGPGSIGMWTFCMFVLLQLGLATGMYKAVRWNIQNGWRSICSLTVLHRRDAANINMVVKDLKTNRQRVTTRGIPCWNKAVEKL